MAIAIAVGMVIVALVLLSLERIPLEISSLAIVVLLVFTGLVTPDEALAGFSSDAAIFIFALLAMTQGLGATGVMQLVGRRLVDATQASPRAFLFLLLGTVCAFSSVASNTAVTAAFLPVVLASSAQMGIAPSRLLMPVAFASMLGGMIFLFGTSTNLVVSASMDRMGLGRIGFAELAPVGLPLAVVGIIGTVFLVKKLLPVRAHEEKVTEQLGRREYVTEAVLTYGSRLVGQPVYSLGKTLGMPVRGVVQDGEMLPPDSSQALTIDARIILAGDLSDILRVKDLQSVMLKGDLRQARRSHGPYVLAEVLVPPTSGLAGRSLRELRFSDRFGFVVLAVDRHPGVKILQHLSLLGKLASGETLKTVPLSVGDMLLLSGPAHRFEHLSKGGEFTVLGGVEYERPRYGHAALALAIFLCTVIAAGLRLTSPAIAGLTGLLVMVATGCVDARTAFRVDWRIIIMIGALLTLGLAMERSGAGAFLARGIAPLSHYVGAHGVLAAIMCATIVLSIPMSNQAAALVMLPVSANVALAMGLDPRTFAIGTCLAASVSFMTPLEPSAALVFGPGRYRFSDYLRVGAPLTLLFLVLLTFAVPLVWPFAHR